MTKKEQIKGNKLIDAFMGYIIYDNEEFWAEENRLTHFGCSQIRSNTKIDFFDYKLGKFFDNKTVKCFKSKKYKNFDIDTNFYIEKLQYHSSWDWLMPAVKKFDFLVENKVIDFSSDFGFWCDKIDDAITRTYEIEPVFKIMIEAIEWFNTQSANQ